MNPEKSISARVTFSSSLFVSVDDCQSVSEQLNLRDVMFDLFFEVSRCHLIAFSPPYPIPKLFAHIVQKADFSPLQDFLTELYFPAHFR